MSPDDREAKVQALFERTRVHVKKVMGAKYDDSKATLDSTFAELGVDSLYLTEVAFALLGELDLYIPMARVARTTSVREFLELVVSEQAA